MSALPLSLIEEARRLHGGPERGYHGWSHPEALLGLLAEVRNRLSDPVAVECAIILHDAVYDPRRSDNEARSAALAREMLDRVVPEVTLRRAVELIEATERHLVTATISADEAEDMRIFLDLDLSTLGASAEAFDRYEAGVRHEYRHVPEALFKAGRAAVLERFLERDQLYLSEWGRERFEAKARENLQRSLKGLRKG
jgi:predicted metal-dependent HD superfamily phosphohydrolase